MFLWVFFLLTWFPCFPKSVIVSSWAIKSLNCQQSRDNEIDSCEEQDRRIWIVKQDFVKQSSNGVWYWAAVPVLAFEGMKKFSHDHRYQVDTSLLKGDAYAALLFQNLQGKTKRRP